MIPTRSRGEKYYGYWEDTKPGKIEAAVHVSNVLNLLALILFFFVIFSPFTVWSINSAIDGRFGTGPFVSSSSTQDWVCDGSEWCGSNNSTRIPAQWNIWSIVANSQTACSNGTNIYSDWSKPYGFCEKVDGEFKVIPKILAIQSFQILGFIFILFATCAGCSVRYSRSSGVFFAATLTFVAMVSTLASFSLMATTMWYQDLRSSKGTYLPVFSGDGRLYAMPVHSWNYGAAFGLVIVCWVWTLFAFRYYIYLGRLINDELDERSAKFEAETTDNETSASKFYDVVEKQDVVQS
uniref:Uncharacterized protein n=1 Tax=Aplanochytrium stocchinoi TaxID=215587 RepID=A0A7S3LMN6_9STRA